MNHVLPSPRRYAWTPPQGAHRVANLSRWEAEDMIFVWYARTGGDSTGHLCPACAAPKRGCLEGYNADVGETCSQCFATYTEVNRPATSWIKTYTLDGEPVPDIIDFIRANDFAGEDVIALSKLRVGETIEYGGGAAASFTLRRTS